MRGCMRLWGHRALQLGAGGGVTARKREVEGRTERRKATVDRTDGNHGSPIAGELAALGARFAAPLTGNYALAPTPDLFVLCQAGNGWLEAARCMSHGDIVAARRFILGMYSTFGAAIHIGARQASSRFVCLFVGRGLRGAASIQSMWILPRVSEVRLRGGGIRLMPTSKICK
jgi:hypothetical protein